MKPSRLTQARGLKLSGPVEKISLENVAPHAGAWIETSVKWFDVHHSLSRLTQARGLKRRASVADETALGSRLTQARGLKR